MDKKTEITYIYIEKEKKNLSFEEEFLKKVSKETFSKKDIIILSAQDPLKVTINEILEFLKKPFAAISLSNSLYFSENWEEPLIEAINNGYELASPICTEIYNIELPYYTPLTFNDVAKILRKKHEGKYIAKTAPSEYVFLFKSEKIKGLNSKIFISEIPKFLKSAVVPSSIVHKFVDYYGSLREDILPLLPASLEKVLDIGCAKGFLGEIIKKEKKCKVYGVEINKEIAKEASKRLDKVFCLNIEKEDLPFKNEIDLVICADVLEHLFDPWKFLKKAKGWLKNGGTIIASIPNVSHYSIILDLLRGRWDYVPWGLLCISHLRFFTKETIEEIFKDLGYKIHSLLPQNISEEQKNFIKETLLEYIKPEKIKEEFFYPGFYVIAKK